MYVSFIHKAGVFSRAEKEIPNMDKSSSCRWMKTVLCTEKQKWLEIWRHWTWLQQYMVYLCFSSHLQVINKVYEQCSANWHSIYYTIKTILPYYVIVFIVYKQIIIIQCLPQDFVRLVEAGDATYSFAYSWRHCVRRVLALQICSTLWNVTYCNTTEYHIKLFTLYFLLSYIKQV